MNILICAATPFEIEPLSSFLEEFKTLDNNIFQYNNCQIRICITGVGGIAATHALTKFLGEHKVDFAIQAGIAGSFAHDLKIGQVVLVQSEQYGDLGAEDDEQFLDIFELNLAQENELPFTENRLDCPLRQIPFPYRLLTVNGLSVNAGGGKASTIEYRKHRFGCQTESMEGAAFHYVCLRENVPFMQLRSISNYIEPRDRSKWKIKEAIHSLNNCLIKMLEENIIAV